MYLFTKSELKESEKMKAFTFCILLASSSFIGSSQAFLHTQKFPLPTSTTKLPTKSLNKKAYHIDQLEDDKKIDVIRFANSGEGFDFDKNELYFQEGNKEYDF